MLLKDYHPLKIEETWPGCKTNPWSRIVLAWLQVVACLSQLTDFCQHTQKINLIDSIHCSRYAHRGTTKYMDCCQGFASKAQNSHVSNTRRKTFTNKIKCAVEMHVLPLFPLKMN